MSHAFIESYHFTWMARSQHITVSSDYKSPECSPCWAARTAPETGREEGLHHHAMQFYISERFMAYMGSRYFSSGQVHAFMHSVCASGAGG